jgi:hypothetical protein
MLQHNTAVRLGQRAHVAHAAVLALHAACCGLPLLAMGAAALTGLASGSALLGDTWAELHGMLHGNEAWIVSVSAALVLAGGVMESLARRGPGPRRFPWLFAVSAACFAANVAILLVHRAG